MRLAIAIVGLVARAVGGVQEDLQAIELHGLLRGKVLKGRAFKARRKDATKDLRL